MGNSLGIATAGGLATLDALAGGNAAGRFTVVTNTYPSPPSLLCSPGLPAGEWVGVGTALTGNGETMTLVDPEVSLTSQRFYRVGISR